jgi:hypothetical protein
MGQADVVDGEGDRAIWGLTDFFGLSACAGERRSTGLNMTKVASSPAVLPGFGGSESSGGRGSGVVAECWRG